MKKLRAALVHRAPVLQWRDAGVLFEDPGKMLWVLKTQLIGNFTQRLVRIENFLFGYINQLEIVILVGRFSSFHFNQISKIIG